MSASQQETFSNPNRKMGKAIYKEEAGKGDLQEKNCSKSLVSQRNAK